MPTRTTINLLACLSLVACCATFAAAQHNDATRALANGPTAIPAEPEIAQPEPPADEAEAQGEAVEAQQDVTAPPPVLPNERDTPLLGNADSAAQRTLGERTSVAAPTRGLGVVRTLGALALVIGLVLVLRSTSKWLAKRAPSLGSQLTAGGRAPSGLLEVLGRYPVARGQKLVLLRLDRRVLLLSQTTGGFTTLAELTDPEEVASILTKARDAEGDSLASRFTSVLRSMERDPELAPEGEVVEVEEVDGRPRSPRLAMDDDRAELLIEPKISPRSSADALTERLRSMKERWA